MLRAGPRPPALGACRRKPGQNDEKGPAARRRPMAAREAYSLYVERAAEGANEADGPLSAAPGRREGSSGKAAPDGCTRGVLSVRWACSRGRQRSRWALIAVLGSG